MSELKSSYGTLSQDEKWVKTAGLFLVEKLEVVETQQSSSFLVSKTINIRTAGSKFKRISFLAKRLIFICIYVYIIFTINI